MPEPHRCYHADLMTTVYVLELIFWCQETERTFNFFLTLNPPPSRSTPQVPGLMLYLDLLAETVKEMGGPGCTMVSSKLCLFIALVALATVKPFTWHQWTKIGSLPCYWIIRHSATFYNLWDTRIIMGKNNRISVLL